MNATTLEDRAARIDKLVTLRSRINDELRTMLPPPAKRTAEQWLAIIGPDDDAAQHRLVLEALSARRRARTYPQGSECGSPYAERDSARMRRAPEAYLAIRDQGSRPAPTCLRGSASRG